MNGLVEFRVIRVEADRFICESAEDSTKGNFVVMRSQLPSYLGFDDELHPISDLEHSSTTGTKLNEILGSMSYRWEIKPGDDILVKWCEDEKRDTAWISRDNYYVSWGYIIGLNEGLRAIETKKVIAPTRLTFWEKVLHLFSRR